MCWEFDSCQMYRLIKLFSKIGSSKLQIKPRCFCLQRDFSCWTTNYIGAIAKNINIHALMLHHHLCNNPLGTSLKNVERSARTNAKYP